MHRLNIKGVQIGAPRFLECLVAKMIHALIHITFRFHFGSTPGTTASLYRDVLL